MGHGISAPLAPREAVITRYAAATLPTRHGTFRLEVFRETSGAEHMAVVLGDVTGERVLCRVHSECWTGEVLGSLRCDCRAQLDSALERMAREGRGVLVYLRQEGRGIGLGDKVRAYALQDDGADTVEANLALGLPVDARRYEVAAAILRELGVESVNLLTNNPDKIIGLQAAGIPVTRRIAHWVPSSMHSAAYLETKRLRLGHLGVAPAGEVLAPRPSELVPWGLMAETGRDGGARRPRGGTNGACEEPASITSGGDERTLASWRR